jgi:exopolysaccharide biosynthesis polyprenyl glycosylphosphotransferase
MTSVASHGIHAAKPHRSARASLPIAPNGGAVAEMTDLCAVPPAARVTPAKHLVPRRAVWQRRYSQWLQVSDLIVATVAVALAQAVRFGGQTTADLGGHTSVDYSVVSALIVGSWAAFLAIYRTRSSSVIGAGSEEFRRVWTATLLVFGGIAIVSTLFKLDIARGYLAIALPLGLVGLSVNRHLARKVVAAQRRRGRMLTAVLALGEPTSITTLAQSLARHPEEGYTVVGACTPGRAGGGVLDVAGVGALPMFGHDGDIRAAVVASGADTVALTSTGQLGPQGIRDLSWQLDKLEVDLLVSPGMVDVAGPRLTVRPVADLPLIQMTKPQYDGAKGFQKLAFDVCFALMAMLAALPVMLIAAAAVKLTSKGPVFYLSERIGQDGRPFRMIKFRTMTVDAEQRLPELAALNESAGGVLFKIRRDPRVTPVGRLLRRYSIDELPQFINVLRRDMSVVGPRPPLPNEALTYDNQVRRRLLVRPGITGLWQVSGRSELSWDDSVRLDLFYVENWSMLSDLAIAVKTATAVWRGAGAY